MNTESPDHPFHEFALVVRQIRPVPAERFGIAGGQCFFEQLLPTVADVRNDLGSLFLQAEFVQKGQHLHLQKAVRFGPDQNIRQGSQQFLVAQIVVRGHLTNHTGDIHPSVEPAAPLYQQIGKRELPQVGPYDRRALQNGAAFALLFGRLLKDLRAVDQFFDKADFGRLQYRRDVAEHRFRKPPRHGASHLGAEAKHPDYLGDESRPSGNQPRPGRVDPPRVAARDRFFQQALPGRIRFGERLRMVVNEASRRRAVRYEV